MEDHEIVALYWRRSERAVAETDAKYGAFCHTVALGLLSVREDAEECVNDAYQAAWESMPEEKPDKLRAWLGRVVRNLSIDRWRKNHRQKRYAGLETLLSELDDLISAAYAVERAEYPKSHTVVGDAAPDDGAAQFFAAGNPQFLAGTAGQNRVYSPLSAYLAQAMAAELTDGESRAQIMNLLGEDDIAVLRARAHALWNLNYYDIDEGKSILASSLWMSKDVDYARPTPQTLAENYYASSFYGKMGSFGYDRALQSWLNGETHGKLDGSASGESMDEHFAAVQQTCKTSATMWYILPDEGVTPEELLHDPEFSRFLTGEKRDLENRRYLYINLAVPKFDVSCDLDMKGAFRSLGVTDIFDYTISDFTPLTTDPKLDGKGVYLSDAKQAARVTIDEEGCEATTYIKLNFGAGAAAPPTDEIDFTLDRPFLFAVTNSWRESSLPLFVGVVNQP